MTPFALTSSERWVVNQVASWVLSKQLNAYVSFTFHHEPLSQSQTHQLAIYLLTYIEAHQDDGSDIETYVNLLDRINEYVAQAYFAQQASFATSTFWLVNRLISRMSEPLEQGFSEAEPENPLTDDEIAIMEGCSDRHWWWVATQISQQLNKRADLAFNPSTEWF